MLKNIIETYVNAFTADDSLFKNLGFEKEFVGTEERADKFLRERFAYGEIPTEKQAIAIIMKSAKIYEPGAVAHHPTVRKVGIKVLGLCPHHFAPVNYTVDFAYRPQRCLVGISKISRFIEYLFRFPVVQEDLTTNAALWFDRIAGAKSTHIKVVGKHACVGYRGVKQHTRVETEFHTNFSLF